MLYKELDKLTPRFKKKVELFLAECDKEIFITESWRSQERQQDLYNQGRTTPGNIVTWTLNSNHTKGEAIDIAFHGTELYPASFSKWEDIAEIAKKYGIDWGYDLWGKDKPHFQCNGKDLAPFKKNELDVKIENKCNKETSNACFNYAENTIYLQKNYFNKTPIKKEAILEHEYAHYVLFKKVPLNIIKIWKSISEFESNIIQKLNKGLGTNYTKNEFITEYAKTNFKEDFSECIEENFIKDKKGDLEEYKGYLGLKVGVANYIYNKYK